MSDELIRLEARCVKATRSAILVEVEGEEVWIPQSVVHDDSEVWKHGDEGLLVIPKWIAQKKGLV